MFTFEMKSLRGGFVIIGRMNVMDRIVFFFFYFSPIVYYMSVAA